MSNLSCKKIAEIAKKYNIIIIEERKDEIIKRNEATNKILSEYNLIK
ncbi:MULTISPECIES: hypothetical protein [unclassified Clostridioides]